MSLFLTRSISEDFMNDQIGRILTPQPSPSQAIDVTKLTLDDDDATYANEDEFDDFNGDEEEDSDFQNDSGTMEENDFYKHNPALVIVDPGIYTQYGGSGNSSPLAYSGGFSNSSSKASSKSASRTGPLREREVEVLKKGVEEAIKSRTPEVIEEEQLEQIDAAEERALRVSATAALNSSSQHAAGLKRFKLLMLGDSGVGKSSLMIRWTEDSFSTDLVGTVGVNFKTKREIINGDMVHAQVWDTAGQEQFHKITTSYYKGAHGIMLVYDVSDPKSWDNIQYWVKNIRAHASESVQIVLVGNKVDLRDDPSNVGHKACTKPSFGKSFSKKFGIPYFETSAKNSLNVSLAFNTLLTSVLAVAEVMERNNAAAKKVITDRLQQQQQQQQERTNSVASDKESTGSGSGSAAATEYVSLGLVGIGEGGGLNNNTNNNRPRHQQASSSKRSTSKSKNNNPNGDKCVIS